MVVYVTAADPEVVAAADDGCLCELLTGPDAWQLENMWWVAVSLLTPGFGLIDGRVLTDAFDDAHVLCLDRDAVTIKLDDLSCLDRDELLRRFHGGSWRSVPFGPEPSVDDAEWIVESALQLVDVYRDAVRNGHVVLTAVV
jgi:hypothetical protein